MNDRTNAPAHREASGGEGLARAAREYGDACACGVIANATALAAAMPLAVGFAWGAAAGWATLAALALVGLLLSASAWLLAVGGDR